MPVLERDPWRDQYFEHVPCPDDVLIPTDDPDCWALFPEHRWIYDKIRIAESQGIACGPHGVSPSRYPVFSKPIVNLKGMGLGSRAIADAEEMEQASRPGFMWMELLEGPHVSTDCAIENGCIVWSRHATGLPWNKGMFRYWTIHADKLPALESYLSDWTARHMTGYSGMLNFETIGGRIIEAHLRFADQWCDLYGKGWVEALVGLYSAGAGASMMASGAAATRSPLCAARKRLPAPRAGAAGAGQGHAARRQPADHVPRNQARRRPPDAARRLPPCRHQRYGS